MKRRPANIDLKSRSHLPQFFPGRTIALARTMSFKYIGLLSRYSITSDVSHFSHCLFGQTHFNIFTVPLPATLNWSFPSHTLLSTLILHVSPLTHSSRILRIVLGYHLPLIEKYEKWKCRSETHHKVIHYPTVSKRCLNVVEMSLMFKRLT